MTIGEWGILEDLRGVLVLNPIESERKTDFEKYHGRALDYFLEKQTPEVRESSVAFLKYISKKFSEIAYDNLKTYIVTSAFSNWALHHTDGNAECIIYPSVPFSGKGINYAIRNDFTENLRLKSVIRNTFSVTGNAQGKFDFNEIEIIESKKIDHTLMKIDY